MDVITTIQTLGLPIAATIGVAWYFVKTDSRVRDEAKQREDNDTARIDKLAGIISENTQVIKEATSTNADLAKTNALLAVEVKAGIDKILGEVRK